MLQLLRAGEQYGFKMTFAAAVVPPPLPGSHQDNPMPLPWREIMWVMQGGGLSPESVMKDFDGPGFRIKSIRASFNDGLINWDLEGSQYVLP